MTNSRKKNILITGATGFIGSHVLHRLLRFGYNVTILKYKLSDTWRIKDILDKVKIFDIDDIGNYQRVMKERSINGIIHVATKYIKNNASQKEIEEMVKVNVLYPTLLLEAAIKVNVEFFINTGTFSEYKVIKKPLTEASLIEPINYYSSTKSVFENILKYYSQKEKINGLTLKLFSPYGEKDNQKIIFLMIRSFIKSESLATTKGKQKLSFTYISDIVDAYIKAINHLDLKNNRYEEFNIGQNKTYSIIEIIKILQKISNKKSKVNLGAIPYNEGEIMYSCCDNAKALEKLKWRPKVDLVEGLNKTYNFYKNLYDTGSEY